MSDRRRTKTEGKNPKATKNKARTTISCWVHQARGEHHRHFLNSSTSQRYSGLNSNLQEGTMGDPKSQGLKGRGGCEALPVPQQQEPPLLPMPRCRREKRVSFGLQWADWFGDSIICFSLAPACQVLPLITLICAHGGAPHPGFLHGSASSFCVFLIIKRRKTIVWPQVRIRGWYLCPTSGDAVGQIA